MGKVLKVVGTAVAIVGLAAASIATFGGAAALAGFIGVSTATLSSITTGLLIGGAVLQAAGAALAPKPAGLDGAEARGNAFADPNAAGVFQFGETAAPMAVVFEQNHGTDKELVTDVFAHAWHQIDSYISLHVDGEAVTFSGDNATGAFAGILTWKRNLGTAAQAALALAGTVWPASANGKGVAHSALVWNFKNQEKLKGGVPNRLVVRARGAKLYDPRLDSTVGGAGTQRYSDPATWTWNDGNAALVALRYLIGEKSAGGKLIWGVGEAQGDVDLASFMAAANIADELRDGVKRHRLGGVFETSNDHEEFFSKWEANTGGKIARVGGKRFCWLPNNDLVPLATLTDADMLGDGGVEHIAGGDLGGLYNTARGRFISPSELYQAAPYPEVEEASAVTDDGKSRILDLDFAWVQDIESAERIARLQVRRSRFQRVWRIVMAWKGFLYSPFDVLTLNCQETNFTDQLVRVVDMPMSAGGAVALTLQEEDASIYDETLPLGTPPAAGTIPDRLDRLGTVTPRYIDNTSVDNLKPAGAGATRNLVTSGTATPTGGADGDLYFETDAEAWWSRIAGVWQKVSDATAANIAAGIAGQGALATKNTVDLDSDVAEGTTYQRVKAAALTTGQVDLAKAGVINRTLANVSDTATRFAAAEAGANKTETRVAAAIAGQGALATKNAVDLATGEVTNKSADNIAEAATRKWAGETGADVTARRIGGNLLVNGGFETGTSEGWSSPQQVAVTAGAKRNGGFGAQITITPNASAVVIWQTLPAPPPGDRLLLQGFARRDEASIPNRNLGLVARFGDASGALISATSVGSALTTVSGWQVVRGVAVVPSGAVSVQFRWDRSTPLNTDEAGVWSVDDHALHIIPKNTDIDAVAVTNSPLAAAGKLKSTLGKDEGGIFRSIPVDAAEDLAFDGDNISFSQNWSGPPLIRFGGGGRGYNPAFAASQQQVFRPLNLTASGFTASLRLKETSGTTTPVSDGPGSAGGGGAPDLVIEKSASGEDKDDTYRFNVSVTVNDIAGEPNSGFVTVGYYTRTTAGGAWTKRAEVTFDSGGSPSVDVVVGGLGADAAFGVSEEAFIGASGIDAFNFVSYTTQAAVNEVTATPAGASGIPFHQIGNKAIV